MENNQLAQKFNFIKLMKFTTPTMIMMIFMSLYQTVDGIFVSNFVGDLGLTALNIVYPFTCILIAVSIMLATGSGAIIALNMGEQKNEEAKENFTFIILLGIVFSLVIMVLAGIYIEPLIYLLGATPRIYQLCYDYLWVMILSAPFAVLQLLFQTFFVVAGKPKVGLILTITGGVCNIVLDYLLVAVYGWGIFGAALATAVGYGVIAVYGLFYFLLQRSGTLYFVKPKFRFHVLKNSCMNGMSEMVNNLAVAITTYLFNIIGIAYLQEEGVAAISIILYAQFIMTSVFTGYSTGAAPIFSYKYGANDTKQIQQVFQISMKFIVGISAVTVFLAFVLAKPIALVFASDNPYVFDLSVHGFHLFALSFIFTGLNIFASALFTAFSNGVVSGGLSFLRTFVFLVIALLALPPLMGQNGIWLAVPIAEGISILFSVFALYRYRQEYHLTLFKEKKK